MNDNNTLSEKIVALRLKTRLATMCECSLGKKKNTLSLESKVLFLLSGGAKSPSDIETALALSKTNLVLLCNRMCRKNLLIKYHSAADSRRIMLQITDDGQKHLSARLSLIEERCKSALTPAEYAGAQDKLDEALRILDFI